MDKELCRLLTISGCLVAFFTNKGLANHHSYNGLDLLEHYGHHPRRDHIDLAALSPQNQEPMGGAYPQAQEHPDFQLPPQDGSINSNYYSNREHGIICYECNSEFDPRCKDPFDPYTIGMVNCSLKAPLEHLRGFKPVLCRKTIQKIYGEVRVTRGCGYVIDPVRDDGLCVHRSGTHDVSAKYCSCTTSLCNKATQLPIPNIIGFAALSLLFYGHFKLLTDFST